ncbi:ArsR/SmtB family transcription factor [Saccharophagus degradans]|uniref:Metalloregulator ArsR/SmtB family transcription factor n=1 Tax=Saccharophagus degradans TaxID=86304 RepID=A0AAW7X6A7_9GAMM|nr:metalloregulator ArsR/SmtB family transcription factor [Saccharophagus degradans]MDO6422037.1 metalloregulator ArsR/SmtB family transcription factor [Saccharophagus degradans]MDO6609764.1 metalloregulator ArsR/SmtB family transcription factor [Saccharophagus degradans]
MNAPLNTTTKSASPIDNPQSALVRLLKAAGDELRVEILRALSTDSFGVLELCQVFETKQSGMSHHLKVLANAGLVCTRREGNSIFYRRDSLSASGEFSQLKAELFSSIDALPLSPEVAERKAGIYKQRAEASRIFFAEQAGSFKQQQDLIAGFDVYGPQIDELLATLKLPSQQRALEIGPGEGDFLPYLSKRFNNVIALDNASTMLQKAQAYSEQQALNNIQFVLNDTSYCSQQPNSLDCVVINMVLHHTPSPNQIFADVSQALKTGGALIVCELCEHDQDWAKQACGDIWLGFAPADLSAWAKEHNLYAEQNIYFALRNGFQIQIQQFTKRINT